MKHKILSLMLVAALALSLTVPALAAGQTFSDVPESYWGYADIEAVSKAGYMKEVGGGRFSPENKVTVAQFLTLLGRLVFPDVKADGADWYGPYVTAAKDAGLLTGSQVDTNNLEAEITRYDMAVILRAAAKKLGVTEKSAQSSEVTDYGMIPNMYTEAVLAVYGMGLIKGVGGGSFNGTGTMRRAEVATVIMRLGKVKPSAGGTVTQPEQGDASLDDVERPNAYLMALGCHPRADYDPSKVELVEGDRIRIDRGFRTEQAENSPYISYSYFRVGETYQFTVCKVPAGYGYTKADVRWESSNEQIATVDQNGVVTIVGGPGDVRIYAKIPVHYYNDHFVDDMDAITLCVDP